MELLLDTLVLTSDCKSDVFVRAEKKERWGLELLCVSLSKHSCVRYPCKQKFVEPLVELGPQVL